jgi:hypothetical protein
MLPNFFGLPLFYTTLQEFLCGHMVEVEENNFFTFLM